MSAPNGQQPSTMPSNDSTTTPYEGTEPMQTDSPVTQGAQIGQDTNIAPTRGGRGQDGGRRTAGQNMNPRGRGNGRGRGFASGNTSRIPSRAPSEAVTDQGTRISSRKRLADAMAEGIRKALAERQRKKANVMKLNELNIEHDALGDVTRVMPKNPNAPSTIRPLPASTNTGCVTGVINTDSREGIETIKAAIDAIQSRFGHGNIEFTLTRVRTQQEVQNRRKAIRNAIDLTEDPDEEEQFNQEIRDWMHMAGDASAQQGETSGTARSGQPQSMAQLMAGVGLARLSAGLGQPQNAAGQPTLGPLPSPYGTSSQEQPAGLARQQGLSYPHGYFGVPDENPFAAARAMAQPETQVTEETVPQVATSEARDTDMGNANAPAAANIVTGQQFDDALDDFLELPPEELNFSTIAPKNRIVRNNDEFS